MSELVLDGLRVLDLSWGLAGSVATQMLAEVGADVIKVEPPDGDPVRRLHPAAFATWNRSKRSVVVPDLDDPQVAELVADADVVVHSLRPSVARRHGLDDDTLLAAHDRLIVCAVTGYPAGHADVERPGYDLLVQAREGLMDIQSGWRDGPWAWRFPAPSWGAAYLAAAGIVARLFHRERTGRGGVAHTSLAQGTHLIHNILWNRAENPPATLIDGQPGTMTATQVAMYQCSDGDWIQILNPADRVDLSQLPLMRSTLAALGLADKWDADVMRAAVREHPSEAWLQAIRAVDVAVEVLAPLGSLFDHEQVAANGYSVEVEDPEWGPSLQASPPFVGEGGWRVQRPAPRLGEHSGATFAARSEAAAAAAAAKPDESAETGADDAPLAGVKVVDFGAFLAGPLAPMLLADLGAEVINVEPVTGDAQRGWRDGFYVACNRGKRGIAFDINGPGGREIVERLIRWSDVVHHNIRAKNAARLRMDGPAVAELNPDAIYSHCSSYGLLGERADWPGYDSVFQAMGGWNVELAGQGNPPLFIHTGYMDILTATGSAIATLLALYQRQRTGRAGATETALLNTATFTNSETLLRLADHTIAAYPKMDKGQFGLSAGQRLYQLSDGWIAVAALGAKRMAALRAVAGVPADSSDGESTDGDSPADGPLADSISDALSARRGEELLRALTEADVPAELVREFRWFELWDDEEDVRTRTVVSYPQRDWGRLDQYGAFWNLGDLELVLDRACPALSEHSREILLELGFDAEAIDSLVAKGTVAPSPS